MEDALLHDIVVSLEEILSRGKARSKMLLSNHLFKLRIEQWVKSNDIPHLWAHMGKIVPIRIRFSWHSANEDVLW